MFGSFRSCISLAQLPWETSLSAVSLECEKVLRAEALGVEVELRPINDWSTFEIGTAEGK
ncbi:MAG: hypothetical protein ACTS6G_02190 [Candidatus Hodgkinia cicadicola]